jgi:2-hydroxy-6-oxonona-2,4-dienedioate hydrolase
MQEQFLDIEYNNQRIRIRYLESANNSKQIMQAQHLLLFIHGLGSSAERWLDIPDALSLYYHTVAIDLPGFGGSDKPSDMEYTIEAFSAIVKLLIQKVAITDRGNNGNKAENVTLIGHSLGGYIATKIASQEDSNFLYKLILVDSSGNLERPTPLLDQYLDAAMNPSKEKVRNVFEQMVANPILISDALVQGFIDRVSNHESRYAFDSALRNSANTQIGRENLNKIGEKKIPTLIIWGMYDRVIPPNHSEIFKNAIRGSSVIMIPRSGHAPFTEMPALVCEHMHRFLIEK